MGKINDLLCDLLGLAEYNADFWNGTVFQGKKKITGKQLARQDREYYKTGQPKAPGVRRDILMHCKVKPNIMLGVEIMETLDYTIPVKLMDYDAQELKRQIKDIKQRNSMEIVLHLDKWASSGEFLYGLRKKDKLIPVYTVALYCGDGEYDGAGGIQEMMDTMGLDEECRGMLKDYPIKVYHLKDLKEENYENGLREIIAVFKRSGDRQAIKEYYLANKVRFQRMDELAIDTMGALIGIHNLKIFRQEEGGVDMCKAFEEEREEGRLEGKLEGMEEALNKSIQNLMLNLKLTSQQAMEALGIPRSEWTKYQQ